MPAKQAFRTGVRRQVDVKRVGTEADVHSAALTGVEIAWFCRSRCHGVAGRRYSMGSDDNGT